MIEIPIWAYIIFWCLSIISIPTLIGLFYFLVVEPIKDMVKNYKTYEKFYNDYYYDKDFRKFLESKEHEREC